ncbi:hypothetical protein [Tardiphaga sp. 839_C3_N1_4]|uniref:hypothetical protein n=1 Tax=Tardiphaga sp. 839_C3_N1_4 TaxID=3240761 RepID=UPI003F27AEC8
MTVFEPNASSLRRLGVVFFCLWGFIGLGIAIFAGLGAPILTAIYVTLMWMAGVIFFGLAVLMAETPLRLVGHGMPVYVVAKPAEDGLNFEYRGIRYAKFEDGKILAEFGDGNHTFKSWKKFVEAVPDEN